MEILWFVWNQKQQKWNKITTKYSEKPQTVKKGNMIYFDEKRLNNLNGKIN